jgi:hypothetical protein
MEFQTLSASAPNRRTPRIKRGFLRIVVSLGGWYVVSSHGRLKRLPSTDWAASGCEGRQMKNLA